MFRLDWFLFGNGWGMASPHCDDVFYWLKDTSSARAKAKGRFYRVGGGLGAQLSSVEWITPPPGTERVLAGMRFRPFSVSRRGPRVMVSWARVPAVSDAAEASSTMNIVKNWGHGND